MAELFEPGEGAEAEASPAVQTDTSAVAIALDRARRRKGKAAANDEVDRFLEKQEGLIDDQRAHLHEQMRDMRLKRLSERLKVTGQFLTIGVGVAVAFGVAALFWTASQAGGVVVEAFSVPPELEAKGLSGKVLAGQLQDKLSELQAQTRASRAAATYANDWGRDIKVEIPETGVSIGEVQRFLRGWLGHETHIGGDLFESADGLKLTVRADGVAGDAVTGTEDRLDDLVTAGALALYKKTQAYRWAAWMADHGHEDEAAEVARQVAQTGTPEDRAWAMNMLVSIAPTQAEALDDIRRGIAFDPNLAILWRALGGQENLSGHFAARHAANERTIQLMRRPDHGGYNEQNYVSNLHASLSAVAADVGDYETSLREAQIAIDATPPRPGLYGVNRIQALAGLHRSSEVRAIVGSMGDDAKLSGLRISNSNGGLANLGTPNADAAIADADWPEAYRQLSGVQAMIEGLPPDFIRKDRFAGFTPTYLWPRMAEALAHMGRMDEARALIGKTPTDCYPCVRARAKIAALAGQKAEADRWFAEAERQAPGFVIASTEWGEALLRRGDYDRAIDKLKEAHRIGPKFADPLVFWGEALAAKGDFRGAASKFGQANDMAPKWGRLHLKWAEALARLGKAHEARAQAKTASGLDLTADERAELGRVRL